MSLLTTQEAAERMRCHPETIRRAVRSGSLPARHFGGKWLIDEEALEAPRPQRVAPVRPRRGRATGRFAKIAESMNRSATS